MEELLEAFKVISDHSLKNDHALLQLIEAVIEKLDKLEKRVNDLSFDVMNSRVFAEARRDELDHD